MVEEKLKELRKISQEYNLKIEEMKQELAIAEKSNTERFSEISDKLRVKVDMESLPDFFNKPYVLIPTGKQEEWYVPVPKFIRMNLGWLEFSTESFNVFKINKYMNWLGELPAELESKFSGKMKLPLKVFDGMLLTGKEHQEEAWKRFGNLLSRREGKDKIKIKKGYEFKLLSELIENGIMPFMKQPVQPEDLLERPVKFTLRDYQMVAWKKFLETGATGVFWAFSAGKTFFGLKALSSIKGNKLVVVPTVTLVEQWRDRLQKYTEVSREVEIVTYHSFEKVKNKEWSLVIFDECQHLPANQFSRFATLNTKYRCGLSGSPFREDHRENYIFALTGFPIGISWDSLIEEGIIEVPDVILYILSDYKAKESKLAELIQQEKKTIIFCDSINMGKSLSKRFEIPFVYGQTKERLEIINESDVTIVSRVGDEGLSLPDIERVIEVSFLFGSRRQEGQRMGRLFHGEKKGEHIILMTEKEYEDYGKRLFAITERGFKIEVRR